MFARVTTYDLPEGSTADPAVAFGEAIERLRALDGLVEALFLVGRDEGQAITVTFWESADAMERSRVAASRARTDAAAALGAEVASTCEYEVAIRTGAATGGDTAPSGGPLAA